MGKMAPATNMGESAHISPDKKTFVHPGFFCFRESRIIAPFGHKLFSGDSPQDHSGKIHTRYIEKINFRFSIDQSGLPIGFLSR
jgi:hypothetical protein